MEKTLAAINRMQADGIIGEYAIGGAIAAFFYIEPAATFDLDIFIALEPSAGGLISLSPIYDHLRARGCEVENETVTVEGWAVQFLPACNPLLAEALAGAQAIAFKGVPTRILRAEHLMAIALQTGRAKDFARLVEFAEKKVADEKLLHEILARHQLTEKWHAFENRFLKN
jgi:hypothetical protein